jgi:hypothetical protein
MTAASARASQARGAAWEKAIRGDLTLWTSEGILRDWQQQGTLYQRIGAGGRRVVPVEADGPLDFAMWTADTAWAFEAKATGAPRWSFANIEPHQARRMSSWHMPSRGRVAGVALRFDDDGLAAWLPWDLLAPLWSRWAVGDAARGEASLTVEQAARIGTPWGEQWAAPL